MYNKLLPLLLLPLFFLSLHATDLNDTETIFTQASKVTQPIQTELHAIFEENSTQELVTQENMSENNRTNAEITPTIDESNNSIQEKSVVINSVETTVVEASTPTLPFNENNETQVKETLDLTKGNSSEGKKIFIKNLKEKCNTTAYKFAGNYAQEEWQEMAESGKFKENIIKLCPNISETYDENWSLDLYQFFYENANDSEKIPEF